MTAGHRVVCAGHVNWDVTMRVDRLPGPDGEAAIAEERGAGGGSAANVAVGLVGLELDATLLGSVGDDDRGAQARAELAGAGVDVDHVVRVADGRTAAKYLVVDDAGDVFVLGREGANEAFAAEDLPESALAGSSWLHLTGQDPATATELARRARATDVTVSVDPGRRVEERGYAETVAHADVVFLNDREAAAALDSIPEGTTTVIKHGSWGAEVRTDDGTATHDGFPTTPVDTTGAGDAFAAGYIAATLRGDDPAAALATANACGALAAGELGARAELTRPAVRALLEEE